MSKNNKKHASKQSRDKKSTQGLLYSSPLILGLKSLIPVLLILLVLGLVLKSTQGSDQRALMKAGEKVTSPLAHQELAKKAALANDYRLAEEEYLKGLGLLDNQSVVLGWGSELDAVVWPEKNLNDKMKRWLEQVEKTASREIYLKIAIGYWKLGDRDLSFEYWEKARKLDPNDRQVLEVRELYN